MNKRTNEQFIFLIEIFLTNQKNAIAKYISEQHISEGK
jgi:hypothetical protein